MLFRSRDAEHAAISPEISVETRAVIEWMSARRVSAEMHARMLANAFETAAVDTLSEAPATNLSPTAIVEHLVGELARMVGEHV